MKLEWRSFISLKAPVLIAFVALWNAGILYAMFLGGGGPRGGLTPVGMKVTGFVCVAASIFALSVAMSKSVQASFIAPARAQNFHSREFYFLAFVTGVLAISRFVFPEFDAGANAL